MSILWKLKCLIRIIQSKSKLTTIDLENKNKYLIICDMPFENWKSMHGYLLYNIYIFWKFFYLEK